MNKYQIFFNYSFREEHKNTASIKPILDTSIIAERNDFKKIKVSTKVFYLYYQLFPYLLFLKKLRRHLKPIKKSDVVFIQYPVYSSIKFFSTIKFILGFLKKKKAFTVGIIHDVENLRNFNIEKLRGEINLLNAFSVLIVHNFKMQQILEKYGLNTKVELLNVFDYLIENDFNDCGKIEINKPHENMSVVFAGNLNKSSFVNELYKINCVQFDLYGNGYDNQYVANVFYHGSITPEELNKEMSQYSYGLVWDGKSIEELDESEDFSRYMRYNNPFKLSSYISAGLPIITSKDAGIADFVIENNLGIVVNSLNELKNRNIYFDYSLQKQNVLMLKAKLNNGAMLSSILKKL